MAGAGVAQSIRQIEQLPLVFGQLLVHQPPELIQLRLVAMVRLHVQVVSFLDF